ncbi:phage head closure protein [Sphingobium bisphenolivorans]|uniref:phage head closure protein n=1 Tax=Sphingobium bisphenolivorans TaxID=1335760 RepID=UPI0003A2924D|nr:phage head closure protein [Sphingobium bisphenolivorans]
MAFQPLRAGDLRTRIRIEIEGRVSNGQGGWTTAWSPVAVIWAKKVPLRGDEITRDSIQRAVSVTRFVIRHRSDVTAKHRIVEVKKVGDAYEVIGGPWNIRRIDDPYGRRDRLELDCEWQAGLG